MLASADFFHIEVKGRGTHGAYPSAGVDPIIVAAHITTALQTIVSREVAPWDPAVVTVATIHAGTAANIIPEIVHLEGTFRALKPEVRDTIAAAIRRIAEHTAQAFRATATVVIPEQGYPALSNDPGMTEFARATVINVFGPDAFVEIEHPSMGAEDFAFYLKRVPGAMLCLGNASPAGAVSPPLHNPRFNFNDDAIPVGVRLLVELAARFLNTGR